MTAFEKLDSITSTLEQVERFVRQARVQIDDLQECGEISLDCNMRAIIEITAKVFGVPVARILSRKKPEYVSAARQTAMRLCYELLDGATLESVALAFNRKDHATVKHAIQASEARSNMRDYVFKFELCKDKAMKALNIKSEEQ